MRGFASVFEAIGLRKAAVLAKQLQDLPFSPDTLQLSLFAVASLTLLIKTAVRNQASVLPSLLPTTESARCWQHGQFFFFFFCILNVGAYVKMGSD